MKQIVRRVLIALAILFPAAAVLGAINIYVGIDDAYAQKGAAEMVIRYMRNNGGEWPPDWEALRSEFASGAGVGGWSFEKFQYRVYIDFTADPVELRRLSKEFDAVPFNVIHARLTWGVQFEDGPNAMIHRYFRARPVGGG